MGFSTAVAFTLNHEGGYVNDPDDPGGETNFGISKRSYPDVDIAGLTQEDAENIYLRDFWKHIGCMHMPPAVGTVVFDTAVNTGRGVAVRCLQRTLNSMGAGIAADGLIGPKTLQATKIYATSELQYIVAASILLERVGYYSDLCERKPGMRKYLRGWIIRVAELKDYIKKEL